MPSLKLKAPYNALSPSYPRLVWRDSMPLGSYLHAIMWEAVPSKLFRRVILQETNPGSIAAILNEYDVGIVLYHIARRHSINLCEHNIDEIKDAYIKNRKKALNEIARLILNDHPTLRLLKSVSSSTLKTNADITPYFGSTPSDGYHLMWNRALWRMRKTAKEVTQ